MTPNQIVAKLESLFLTNSDKLKELDFDIVWKLQGSSNCYWQMTVRRPASFTSLPSSYRPKQKELLVEISDTDLEALLETEILPGELWQSGRLKFTGLQEQILCFNNLSSVLFEGA